MFKKEITYEDLEGNTVQDTFYFNFTLLEIIELLEIEQFEENLKRLGIDPSTKGITEVENTQEAYDIFKDLILRSYGHKTANGRGFDKKDANGRPLKYEFEASLAMPEMIIEFLKNPKLAGSFIEQCLPPKQVALAKAELEKREKEKLSDQDVTDLVEEAARRQEDPATAVAPSEQLQELQVQAPEKKFDDYSKQELLDMSTEDFKKLIPSKPKDMSKKQLQIAMERNNK